jgi:hypothetical protein
MNVRRVDTDRELTHRRGARKRTPAKRNSLLYFRAMSDRTHNDFHACPACDGKGTVPSRLPFRTKPCEHCRGRGIVPPLRREQLLAKLKANARGQDDRKRKTRLHRVLFD